MLYSCLIVLSYLVAMACAAPISSGSVPPAVAAPILSNIEYGPASIIYRRALSLSTHHARSPANTVVYNYLRKRELIINMLNGAPVESQFVNLLDLWHMAEKAIARTPEGTPRHAELVDFQETTATELTRLMRGVAVLQSVVVPEPSATPTPELEKTTVEVEATASPDVTIAVESIPTPSSTSSSSEQPEATPEPASEPVSDEPVEPATVEAPQEESTVEVPEATSTTAEPAPVPTPEQPAPAPEPQPRPQAESGATTSQNRNDAEGAQETVAPSTSRPATVSSGSTQAAPAQETDDLDLSGDASPARLPSLSWVVVGALVLSPMVV